MKCKFTVVDKKVANKMSLEVECPFHGGKAAGERRCTRSRVAHVPDGVSKKEAMQPVFANGRDWLSKARHYTTREDHMGIPDDWVQAPGSSKSLHTHTDRCMS